MELKKLLYIKSDKEVNSGMVRVMLELHGIRAEVEEVKLVRKDGQIMLVRQGRR